MHSKSSKIPENKRKRISSIKENDVSEIKKLKVANEELLSGSEELQSLIKELKGNKKEQQGVNELLNMVNKELNRLNDKAESALNYAESIITTLREPLIVLDKDLRVKTANQAFYKIFQVNEDDTEKALIYDLGNKQWNIPALQTLLEEILPQKTKFNDFEVRHRFPKIGERIMLLNAREIHRGKSEEKLILLAIEDVTEDRKLEALLEKERDFQTEVLEEAILERTNELQDANRSLEEMNSELISFNYLISHDLQEPLRKIQMFSGRILETEEKLLSAKGRGYFQGIDNSAKLMQRMILDLLTYSHANINVQKFQIADLNKIIEEVIRDLSELIKEKQAVIKAGKLGEAYINPTQFRQVLINIIDNALKFYKPGIPPRLAIKSRIVKGRKFQDEKLSPGKKYHKITIVDNGIGFDPKHKDLIFKVFQRLHGREAYPGTGIGLAICKRIIENHNGIITASGEPGKGTRIDIYIPTILTI